MMRLYQITILLTSMVSISQALLAADNISNTVNTTPEQIRKQGVVMKTLFPQPQVWINMMPVIGNPRETPTVDVFMALKNNTSQSITYSFSSSQTFDIFIKDSFGNVLSQWSRGLFFAQVLSEITIQPGASEIFGGSIELTTADGMPINPGDYVISIGLVNKTTGSGPALLSLSTDKISAGTINFSPTSQMPIRIDWAF